MKNHVTQKHKSSKFISKWKLAVRSMKCAVNTAFQTSPITIEKLSTVSTN